MTRDKKRTVEARQLNESNVREIAEWIVPPPGRSGYSWYEGRSARFRTLSGILEVPIGSWVVRSGDSLIVLSPAEFVDLVDPKRRSRPLLGGVAAVGLVLGIAGAAAWHYTQVGDVGWTIYAQTGGPFRVAAPPRAAWWPTGLIFPLLGLCLGAATATVLARFGWTVSRIKVSPRGPAVGVAFSAEDDVTYLSVPE
jgi:hypothetical protein